MHKLFKTLIPLCPLRAYRRVGRVRVASRREERKGKNVRKGFCISSINFLKFLA
jgi:hypothetical protein